MKHYIIATSLLIGIQWIQANLIVEKPFSDKYLTQLRCSRTIRDSKPAGGEAGPQHCDNFHVSILIESHSRPMQLYAFLESLQKNGKNTGFIRVLYTVNNADIERAYRRLHYSFIDVDFIQLDNKNSFKDEMRKAILCMSDTYIAFADDELVINRSVDFGYCAEWLEHARASAFYLGLDVNIKHNDLLNCEQSQPSLIFLDEDVYAWELKNSEYAWRKFISTECAIYRKTDMLPALSDASFTNLNDFQLQLAHHFVSADTIGLCLEHSAVLRPQFVGNRVGQDDLCELFNYGFKIDIEQFNTIVSDRLKCSLKPLLKARVRKKNAV